MLGYSCNKTVYTCVFSTRGYSNKLNMVDKKEKDKTDGLHPANFSHEKVQREYKALSKEIQGDETILVVEDEEQVRELVVEMLKTYGYRVLDAYNGKKAIEIYNKYNNDIQLILTDVVMPEIDGAELYKRIQSIIPDIKVLYMSGYTDDIIAEHGVLNEGVTFLQKPIMVDVLPAKVREALDKPPIK